MSHFLRGSVFYIIFGTLTFGGEDWLPFEAKNWQSFDSIELLFNVWWFSLNTVVCKVRFHISCASLNFMIQLFCKIKHRINIQIPKVVCFCVYVCIFAISSANSHQILTKFSFPESTWNWPGLGRKKSGKIRIPGKNRILCVLFWTFGLQFSTYFY